MPNRLLLADEDPQTLRVLEVSLRAAGFEVTSVTTGAAAWVAIDQQLPQVILAATSLAALDGFDLCTRVRAREGGRDVAFILLGDDDTLAYRIKSIEVGADDYLLKPPSVQDVVTRLRALLQRRDREAFTASARAAEALAGQLADLSVVDLLQVISDSRRSGIVHLRGAREAPGTIYFRQGQVVDAEVGRLSGVNAISRLLSWTTGSFEVHWKPIRRPNAIGMPTPELVLEGMKRLDERNRLAGGLPDLDGIYEVNYRVLAERLSEIPDEVNAVLRLFDGSRTLAHVVEDCQLPDPEAMAIAIRLRDEGIIHNVSHPGAAEGSGSLVVPPRPAGRAPSADDVTVVRRITALGTGSGPVQQSFVAATEPPVSAAASSAETVVVARPLASSSFDEVDGELPPAHHEKTDPGFGEPLNLPDVEPSSPSSGHALVSTEAAPPVHAEGSAPHPAEITAPHHAAETPHPILPDEQRWISEPVQALEPPAHAGPAGEAVGLDAEVSSLRTQRGLGPFPELWNAEAALTPAGGISLEATPDPAASEVTRPIEPEPPASLDDLVPAAPAAAMAAPAAEPPRAAPAAEKTMRVNFVEKELSAKEALDELGVPSSNRGLRVVVALAVAGALAAVLVYNLRRAPVAPAPSVVAEAAPSAPVQPVAEPAPATPAPVADEKPAPVMPPKAGQKAADKAPEEAPGTDEPAPQPEKPAATVAAKAPAEAEKAPAENREPAAPAPVAAARPATHPFENAAAPAAKTIPDPAAQTKAAPSATFAHQLATCRSQFLRDRLRDAATTCAAALEANPDSADALTMMAHVELNRGHLGRANELAQRSIGIDPDQADAYVIIGGVHQDSGRNAQAKVAYRRYLQLAPHGRYASEVRSIVGSL